MDKEGADNLAPGRKKSTAVPADSHSPVQNSSTTGSPVGNPVQEEDVPKPSSGIFVQEGYHSASYMQMALQSFALSNTRTKGPLVEADNRKRKLRSGSLDRVEVEPKRQLVRSSSCEPEWVTCTVVHIEEEQLYPWFKNVLPGYAVHSEEYASEAVFPSNALSAQLANTDDFNIDKLIVRGFYAFVGAVLGASSVPHAIQCLSHMRARVPRFNDCRSVIERMNDEIRENSNYSWNFQSSDVKQILYEAFQTAFNIPTSIDQYIERPYTIGNFLKRTRPEELENLPDPPIIKADTLRLKACRSVVETHRQHKGHCLPVMDLRPPNRCQQVFQRMNDVQIEMLAKFFEGTEALTDDDLLERQKLVPDRGVRKCIVNVVKAQVVTNFKSDLTTEYAFRTFLVRWGIDYNSYLRVQMALRYCVELPMDAEALFTSVVLPLGRSLGDALVRCYSLPSFFSFMEVGKIEAQTYYHYLRGGKIHETYFFEFVHWFSNASYKFIPKIAEHPSGNEFLCTMMMILTTIRRVRYAEKATVYMTRYHNTLVDPRAIFFEKDELDEHINTYLETRKSSKLSKNQKLVNWLMAQRTSWCDKMKALAVAQIAFLCNLATFLDNNNSLVAVDAAREVYMDFLSAIEEARKSLLTNDPNDPELACKSALVYFMVENLSERASNFFAEYDKMANLNAKNSEDDTQVGPTSMEVDDEQPAQPVPSLASLPPLSMSSAAAAPILNFDYLNPEITSMCASSAALQLPLDTLSPCAPKLCSISTQLLSLQSQMSANSVFSSYAPLQNSPDNSTPLTFPLFSPLQMPPLSFNSVPSQISSSVNSFASNSQFSMGPNIFPNQSAFPDVWQTPSLPEAMAPGILPVVSAQSDAALSQPMRAPEAVLRSSASPALTVTELHSSPSEDAIMTDLHAREQAMEELGKMESGILAVKVALFSFSQEFEDLVPETIVRTDVETVVDNFIGRIKVQVMAAAVIQHIKAEYPHFFGRQRAKLSLCWNKVLHHAEVHPSFDFNAIPMIKARVFRVPTQEERLIIIALYTFSRLHVQIRLRFIFAIMKVEIDHVSYNNYLTVCEMAYKDESVKKIMGLKHRTLNSGELDILVRFTQGQWSENQRKPAFHIDLTEAVNNMYITGFNVDYMATEVIRQVLVSRDPSFKTLSLMDQVNLSHIMQFIMILAAPNMTSLGENKLVDRVRISKFATTLQSVAPEHLVLFRECFVHMFTNDLNYPIANPFAIESPRKPKPLKEYHILPIPQYADLAARRKARTEFLEKHNYGLNLQVPKVSIMLPAPYQPKSLGMTPEQAERYFNAHQLNNLLVLVSENEKEREAQVHNKRRKELRKQRKLDRARDRESLRMIFENARKAHAMRTQEEQMKATAHSKRSSSRGSPERSSKSPTTSGFRIKKKKLVRLSRGSLSPVRKRQFSISYSSSDEESNEIIAQRKQAKSNQLLELLPPLSPRINRPRTPNKRYQLLELVPPPTRPLPSLPAVTSDSPVTRLTAKGDVASPIVSEDVAKVVAPRSPPSMAPRPTKKVSPRRMNPKRTIRKPTTPPPVIAKPARPKTGRPKSANSKPVSPKGASPKSASPKSVSPKNVSPKRSPKGTASPRSPSPQPSSSKAGVSKKRSAAKRTGPPPNWVPMFPDPALSKVKGSTQSSRPKAAKKRVAGTSPKEAGPSKKRSRKRLSSSSESDNDEEYKPRSSTKDDSANCNDMYVDPLPLRRRRRETEEEKKVREQAMLDEIFSRTDDHLKFDIIDGCVFSKQHFQPGEFLTCFKGITINRETYKMKEDKTYLIELNREKWIDGTNNPSYGVMIPAMPATFSNSRTRHHETSGGTEFAAFYASKHIKPGDMIAFNR